MKFYPHRPDLVEAIMLAPKPMDAAALGRDRSYPLRKDWDQRVEEGAGWEDKLVDDGRGPTAAVVLMKDLFMFEVVLAKFTQNHGIRSILLGTGTLPLVENAIHDPYWGIGCSGTGVNRLGKILMLARDHINNHL